MLSATSHHHGRHLLKHFRVHTVRSELVIFFSISQHIIISKSPRIQLITFPNFLLFQRITIISWSINTHNVFPHLSLQCVHPYWFWIVKDVLQVILFLGVRIHYFLLSPSLLFLLLFFLLWLLFFLFFLISPFGINWLFILVFHFLCLRLLIYCCWGYYLLFLCLSLQALLCFF